MANQLYRSINDKVLGGVCGGMSDFFDIPTVLIRILFLFLLFTGGGLIVYVILWIAMPVQTNYQYSHMEKEESKSSPAGKANSGSILAGVLLISLGAFFLLKKYIPEFSFAEVGPYILIAAGVFLLLKGMQKS
mgnify:CR=1 FL=1